MTTPKRVNQRFSLGLAQNVPGSVFPHPKTGGFYWKLPGHYAPAKVAKGRKIVTLPLVMPGKRYATKNKGRALNCRERLWAEWQAVAQNQVSRKISSAIDEFSQWNLQTAKPAQVATNKSIIKAFVSKQGIESPAQITTDAIEAYLSGMRGKGTSQRTLVKHRNAIRKFCRWMVRQGDLDTNPAALVELRQPVKKPPRYLTDAELTRLLVSVAENGPEWLLEAVCVAVYAGLRLGEIAALRWKHAHKEALLVEDSQREDDDKGTKTGDYRIAPIFPELRPVLDAMTRGKPSDLLFPEHGTRWWIALLEDCATGIGPFGEAGGTGSWWHLLRATFAVNRARKGDTLWELMSHLGHKNPATTLRYISIARAAGMDNIPPAR